MKKLTSIISLSYVTLLCFGAQPDSLTVSNTQSTSVSLNWGDGGCSDNYRVKYKEITAPAFEPTISIINDSSSNYTYLLSSLTPNTNYTWKIKCGGAWKVGNNFTTLNCETTSTDTQTACDSLVWIDGVTYTASNNSATHLLTNANAAGCDSTITLNLTIELGGCTDSSATNFDPLATCDDSSCIGCIKTITQELDGFNPNTITSITTFAYDTLSITNTGNCDINIRPEFTISLNTGPISLTDLRIRWAIPGSGDVLLPYDIDSNGNAYGFFPDELNSNTGINLIPGANQSVFIRIKLRSSADYGKYTAIWYTQEVDTTGSIIQSLTDNDTTILNFVNCNILQPYISFSNITCLGDSNGSASIDSIENGTGNYSYSWINDLTPGNILATSNTIANLSTGDYSCTITDTNGCTLTGNVTISEPAAITVTSSTTDVSCNGGSDGTATLTLSGGTGTLTESWGSMDSTALAQGTHSYTITDTNGCTLTDSVTINEPAAITAGATTTDVTDCFVGNDGSIIINISGGTTPYQYSDDNGNNWGTSNLFNGLTEGPYTIHIKDNNNCLDNVTATITEPDELTSSYTQTNVKCWGENNGSASVNFFGGTTGSNPGENNYILGWDTLLYDLPYPLTEFITPIGVPAGIYPYTVIDINGCVHDSIITITQPDSLYSGYTTGYYNGYEISCHGYNDGEIDIQVNGGTPPFNNYINDSLQGTIMIPNGNMTSAVLIAGTYTDSIVDGNECVATNTIILTEPPALNSTLTPFDVSCNSFCDGEIISDISGGISPYDYEWSNLQSTANASNLCSGWYSLSITDENECVYDHPDIFINQPPEISVSIDFIANITAYAGTDGYIYISSSGGSGLLSTNWTSINGFTSTIDDIVNLSASTYYLEIIDTNSCVYLDTFELTQPSSLWMSIDSVINTSCYDSCNGSINITANGGDSTYTYSWVNILDPSTIISINDDIYNLCYGEYIITVDDGETTLIDTVNIYQPQPITTILSVNPILCNNGTTQAELNVWGGTQPFIYDWSNGGNSYITTISHGTHSINVVDMNGCSFDTSITLANPDSISTQTTNTNTDCFGGNNGSVSINITNGGTSPYNFSNDNGITYQSSNTFNNLSAGNYFFLISDDNNCLGSASAEVIEPSKIISTTTAIDASCYLECDGVASTTAAGGTPPYSYLWTNGDSTQTATDLCAGFYNVTITDTNGCINTNSTIINEPNPLLINIWIDGNNIVATSGFSSYQWYYNNTSLVLGATDYIFTPPGIGIYYVSVSDTNGCTSNSYAIEYNISLLEDYSLTTKTFPNPTNGHITISSEYAMKSISVYNSIGKQLILVNNNENNNNETKLDLSSFAKGVYCIKISITNQIINQRIILQ